MARVNAQAMLDSMMMEEEESSSDSATEIEESSCDSATEMEPEEPAWEAELARSARGNASAASPPPPLLIAQWLKADGSVEPVGRSTSWQELPKSNEKGEVVLDTLPSPAQTAKGQRSNVSFGANASFEAGATPPKVSRTTLTRG